MARKLAFTPLGDKVLIKPAEKAGEKKLASGIIIPESADKEKLLEGVVVATGPGKLSAEGRRLTMEVKPGDTVLFKKPWDEPLKIDGEEHYVLSESDIALVQH